MKPLPQSPPRIGRRDFVALTSAAALAGGALVAGAPAEDNRTSPRGRVGGTIAPAAGFARGGAAIRRFPGNEEAFLGSSPMLGGASPLSVRRRNVLGRH